MLITQKLWERNYNLASLSLNTKFVQGIKNGDLPKTKFQEYLAQDYFFLESFARAYGLAVSKSRNKKIIKTLSVLLSGVSEELILHETYAKEWDIDLTTNLIGPATKKYTDFLEEVSLNLSLIEIMSAMTPCMRLYSWLGKKLLNMISDNPYKEWILTYSDKSFDNLAKSLENLIDEYDESYDIEQVNFLYKRSMELELDFFNAYSSFS
ncbi:TenA family protein [Prochlorococcus marinus]|uniref:TenA family protein n=1 Tax=Prochlorococcus marinus TaxID=1219 RepID=UPI0022B59F62|nr:TenA family protein [Prochlorococcus marinus]